MSTETYRNGQRVLVTFPDSEHRTPSKAVVKKTPPWTENVCGKTVEHTDELLVQYPGTSIDGGEFFADMTEAVPVENVEDR